MTNSLHIGTAFGIPIRLHWTFLFLVLFIGVQNSSFLPVVVVLFGCVLLHELGHSLVARRFGIRVLDISFWPLGGMARMAEIPEDPKVEGLVAIAGPAVNFVLAGLGAAVVAAAALAGSPLLAELAGSFVAVNLLLGTFNLLPAFPMDGGRILRAWFARTRSWVQATEQAVRVGRFLAGAMLGTSIVLLFVSPNLFCALPLIAAFVWFAGGRELMSVRLRHGMSPFGVGGAGGVGARFATAYAHPSGTPPAPEPEPQPEPSAGEPRRPVQEWSFQRAPGGFDDATVRELERFRGPLRRPPRDG